MAADINESNTVVGLVRDELRDEPMRSVGPLSMVMADLGTLPGDAMSRAVAVLRWSNAKRARRSSE